MGKFKLNSAKDWSMIFPLKFLGDLMNFTWKEKLSGDMPPAWEAEIDHFEAQMLLRKAGKIEEKVFAELRLRRGAYGQRYDNGHRHDGITTQDLPYPTMLGEVPLTKGP